MNFSSSRKFPRDVENVERIQAVFRAYKELHPRFIQCFFSYVNFFFLMETGFKGLSKELLGLYEKLEIKVNALRRPARCSYLDKLRHVRNKTIVHWGEATGKESETIEDKAGKLWGSSFSNSHDDLYDFVFGGEGFVGAADRQLLPFRETHRICTEYLRRYDEHCASLLFGLEPHLPKTVDGVRYEFVDPYKEIRSKSE